MALTLKRPSANRILEELAGVLLMVLALVTLLSLFSYRAQDATWFNHQPSGGPNRNLIGPIGANLAEALLQLFGTAAILVPPALAATGWLWLRGGRPGRVSGRLLGYTALALSLSALLDLLYDEVAYGGDTFAPGGYVGGRVAGVLRSLLNTTGALIVSASALATVIVVLTRLSFVRTMELAAQGIRVGWGWLVAGGRDLAESGRSWASRRAERAAPDGPPEPAPEPARSRSPSIRLHPDTLTVGQAGPYAEPEPAGAPKLDRGPAGKRRKIEPPAPRQASLPMEPGQRGYTLPSLDLLNEPSPQAIESEQELLERARKITDKFQEFAVNGSVVAIHPGPVVTTFEFKPEAGIKYSKITSMTDDLSLALKAESVRIDRMPGRATVGIEVPNRRQETIFPRDLFGSETFQASSSKLTLALGKDISGDVYTAELERMPHLLIAGATGSGKSVGLNGMIASILYKATPEDVRFIMIDTKMIELGVYADIPHLLVPVVTDAKHASTALKWAVREMEQRYRKLASAGVRNLAQFNALLRKDPERTMEDPKGGDPLPLTPLPNIVIVIDELADLMLISPADVEESIMRLAQMARAVGIHLIIATQRPSVDVITGTIKANFPSRIAFRVSQRVDSRTIIDQQGAEHLLGRGDMLFLSSGSSRLLRLHGGLVTEGELTRLTSFVKKSAEPVYDESILHDPDEQSNDLREVERDEMYLKAVRTVIQDGKCSITLIQRRLQLGYARAARIVDMMEREGVVSVGEGSKPREVLVGPEFIEEIETRDSPF